MYKATFRAIANLNADFTIKVSQSDLGHACIHKNDLLYLRDFHDISELKNGSVVLAELWSHVSLWRFKQEGDSVYLSTKAASIEFDQDDEPPKILGYVVGLLREL